MADAISAYLEVGPKRTFAGSLEWPGWCRSGRGEAAALEALAAYAERYRRVIAGRVPGFPSAAGVSLDVVDRLAGGSGTDFGAPSAAPSADQRPLDPAEIERQVAILRVSWAALDRAAEAAVGLELTKGPRGGGRDLDKIRAHVLEAEVAYLGQLGQRPPSGTGDPLRGALEAAVRDAAVDAFTAVAGGREPANPNRVSKRWLPRYFIRRAAWHVLDHAWEIEDRAIPRE